MFSNFYSNLEFMSKYDLFALPRSLPACKKHSIELRLLHTLQCKVSAKQQPILAGCSRTAMSCAKSYCYVRAVQWQCSSPAWPDTAWTGLDGWLRNVWRCDDTCELLGWLGWLGWAELG